MYLYAEGGSVNIGLIVGVSSGGVLLLLVIVIVVVVVVIIIWKMRRQNGEITIIFLVHTPLQREKL